MESLNIRDCINLFRLGYPFDTEAVVLEPTTLAEQGPVHIHISPAIASVDSSEESIEIRYSLPQDAVVYGMGENTGAINKRGKKFVCYCTDDYSHTPEKEKLYGSHPFIVVASHQATFGLFVDYPGEMTFDIGYSNRNELLVTIPNGNVDIYEFTAPNTEPGATSRKKQIVRDFRALIGKPYLPPRWGLGYQQCRWSYPDAPSIDAIIEGFRSNDIPCDTVYLDIDYMVDYKNFTVDSDKFPNFANYVAAKKQQGIRLIPIIDAGIPATPGYDVFDEGVEKGYFCTKDDGELFKAAVWPGLCVFPDYLNPEVRQWWGGLYQRLTDQGIEGFWNDMNEPSLFYSLAGIDKAFGKLDQIRTKNIGIEGFFAISDTVRGMSNAREDYKSFYHTTKDGETVCHDDVHNLYGLNMTRAAAEGFEQINPEQRFLMFSRASGIGAHRHAGIWLGDNMSWWEHLLLNIRMMPAVNMCGFLYSGADIGGFGANASADLVTRWTQFGIFTPLLRNHAAMGTRSQEPFAFGEDSTWAMREHIKLRYSLIPFIYSELLCAHAFDESYFWPLGFAYADQRSANIDDQLLIGCSLMIAPVHTENARGRHVYLPESMLLWKVSEHTGRELSQLPAGDHWVDLAIDQLPIFIRPNGMLPLTDSADTVDQQTLEHLEVLVNLHDKAEFTLWHDDGISKAFEQGEVSKLELSVELNSAGEIEVGADVSQGEVPYKTITFRVVTQDGTEVVIPLER